MVKVEVLVSADTWPLIKRIAKKSNQVTVLLNIVLKKITSNTQSHGTYFDIVLGNHALSVQPTD